MSKRKAKKPDPVGKQPQPAAQLRQTIIKRTKAELVDALLE